MTTISALAKTTPPSASKAGEAAEPAGDGFGMDNVATLAGVTGFMGGNIGLLASRGVTGGFVGFGIGAAVGGLGGTLMYLNARNEGRAGDSSPLDFLGIGSMGAGAVLGAVAGPTLFANKLAGGPAQKAIAGGALGMIALGTIGVIAQGRLTDD